MKPDYIKVSDKAVEASGRYALHALYAYVALRLGRRLLAVALAALGTSAAAGLARLLGIGG